MGAEPFRSRCDLASRDLTRCDLKTPLGQRARLVITRISLLQELQYYKTPASKARESKYFETALDPHDLAEPTAFFRDAAYSAKRQYR